MSSCLNCGNTDVERYDIKVRGAEQDGIPLCDACYEEVKQVEQ